MFRRNPYATTGDIFGSLIVFLIFASIIAVILFYIGYIGLIIFLSIGIAIGLAYALYIYIKCFISATKTLSGVSSTNLFKTTVLRWFTLFKNASRDAFLDNIYVAKTALAKSHNYRFFSFRKWMWLIVVPSTYIFGTVLIVSVIALQIFIIIAAVLFVVEILFVLCALMFIADLLYAIIATGINIKHAFAGKGNIFKCFEFKLSSRFSNMSVSIKNYFVMLLSYMKGIWDENVASGQSNVRMGSNYKIISFQRYFLYLSIVTLILISIILNFLILLVLSIAFIPILLANTIWTLFATLIRKIIRKP